MEQFILTIKPFLVNFGNKMENVNLEKDAATIIMNQKKEDLLILCQHCLKGFHYLPCQKKCEKIRKKKIKVVKWYINTRMNNNHNLTKTLQDQWLMFSLTRWVDLKWLWCRQDFIKMRVFLPLNKWVLFRLCKMNWAPPWFPS